MQALGGLLTGLTHWYLEALWRTWHWVPRTLPTSRVPSRSWSWMESTCSQTACQILSLTQMGLLVSQITEHLTAPSAVSWRGHFMSPANFCKRVKCQQPGTHKQQLHTPLLDPDFQLTSLTHSSMVWKRLPVPLLRRQTSLVRHLTNIWWDLWRPGKWRLYLTELVSVPLVNLHNLFTLTMFSAATQKRMNWPMPGEVCVCELLSNSSLTHRCTSHKGWSQDFNYNRYSFLF